MKYSLLKVNPDSSVPIVGKMPASEVERIICPHCGKKTYYRIDGNDTIPAHYTCDNCRDLWFVNSVYVCFELNDMDAPILRGVKSYARAMTWRDADLSNRYFVPCAVDAEPEVVPPRDLFEWARLNSEGES